MDMYSTLCSHDNLVLAWQKARKRKTLKEYVIVFELDLESNLKQLKYELESFTYKPAELTNFIVSDPKTRTISSSHFRDRVIHHAVCNVIGPSLEKGFIYDSFANQKHKGTHLAIKRLEKFLRKVYIKRTSPFGIGDSGFALKADIRHYFDTVDHEILLHIISRKIKDQNVMWLIKQILDNYNAEAVGKGMPLGNLTSQFFANVYLGELDKFVKHKLKVKYYIRYVDDFVILHRDKNALNRYKSEIETFLRSNLKIQLHPEKSRIIPLRSGITFLGFRIFYRYRLLKKSNVRRIWKRLEKFRLMKEEGKMTIEDATRSLEGWLAYAKFANTYNLRNRVIARFNELIIPNMQGVRFGLTNP